MLLAPLATAALGALPFGRRAAEAIVLGGLAATFGLCLIPAQQFLGGGVPAAFGETLRVDGLSALVLVLCGFVGLGMILYAAGTNTLLQTAVHDDYRGRVMSLFTLALIGTSSLGSLITGTIGEHFGAPVATRVAGVSCLFGAAWVANRLRVLAHRESTSTLAPPGLPPAS